MRGCFIKSNCSEEYAWRSVRYVDFERLLASFVYRSQDVCLADALRADIWVLEPEREVPGGQRATYRDEYGNHSALRAMEDGHEIASWNEVSWSEYDIVLGSEPIVPDCIIEQYPRILWCYKSLGHCWPAHRRWAQRPDGQYDLFLNHHNGRPWAHKLPAPIDFPHMVQIERMRRLVSQREPAIFLDHWMVHRPGHGCSQQFYDDAMESYRQLTGLEIRHASGYRTRGGQLVDAAAGRLLSAEDYLRMLGGCKYFIAVREGAAIGQAVTEAAALGCITISNSTCKYAKQVCHPFCLTPTTRSQEDKNIGMRAIRKIEADSALQEEILAHQDERLRRYFWDEPMAILEEALEVKRGHG